MIKRFFTWAVAMVDKADLLFENHRMRLAIGRAINAIDDDDPQKAIEILSEAARK